MNEILSMRELRGRLSDPAEAEASSVVGGEPAPYLIVALDGGTRQSAERLVQPACAVIGIAGKPGAPIPPVVDVVVPGEAALDNLCRAVRANPVAASVLAQVLRHNQSASVEDGLLVESLAYSTLQHGAEFMNWLARRPVKEVQAPAATAEPLLLARAGNALRITLSRPGKRNAFSAALRDALCTALELPLLDDAVQEIIIDGAGPAFCAGGDLDEFGSARDAAIAHASRMTRSAGTLLHRLRERVICHLHGACIGAGIELPAFAGRVRARRDAFIQLPEVSLGLIPGAGGTVSITKRIGRLRTAALALSGERIDAQTALAWGLVDEVVDAFD